MFDSSLFNEYQLFQKFSGLYLKLSPKNTDIDEFLYCANSAILRIMSVRKFNYDCINEFREREPHLSVINTSKINFFSSTLVRLLNEIPIYFSDMRKLQNKLLKVLTVELDLKIHPPKSLSVAIRKKLETFKIPPEICKLIYEYWAKSGKLIKDYRDIDQHWHQIINRVWMQLKPEKKILTILPDGKGKLTYEKNINAIDFMESSFYDFHHMVEEISEILGYTVKKPFPYQIPMNPPAYIIHGQPAHLICLMIFDKGPISGTEFYTTDNYSIAVKLLPKKI